MMMTILGFVAGLLIWLLLYRAICAALIIGKHPQMIEKPVQEQTWTVWTRDALTGRIEEWCQLPNNELFQTIGGLNDLYAGQKRFDLKRDALEEKPQGLVPAEPKPQKRRDGPWFWQQEALYIPQATGEQIVYYCRAGDNIHMICARFGVSASELFEANKGTFAHYPGHFSHE